MHDDFSATYSCIKDYFDPNDPDFIGSISSDPCFVNMYEFCDKTYANGTRTTIIVANANLYEVNDCLEYDDDVIVRTATDVNTDDNTITFYPALDANSVPLMAIYNWGPGVTDVNENLHLKPNSPCICAGDSNGNYAGQTDIDGEPRVMAGIVDIGADEVTLVCTCFGEVNGDGKVNASDILVIAGWIASYGTGTPKAIPCTDPHYVFCADANVDCKIDDSDLIKIAGWISSYGSGKPKSIVCPHSYP